MAGVLELMSRAVRLLRPVDEVARSAAKSEPREDKASSQLFLEFWCIQLTRYLTYTVTSLDCSTELLYFLAYDSHAHAGRLGVFFYKPQCAGCR